MWIQLVLTKEETDSYLIGQLSHLWLYSSFVKQTTGNYFNTYFNSNYSSVFPKLKTIS